MGAHCVLKEFGIHIMNSLINKDMEHVTHHFYSDLKELTKEHLITFDFEAFTTTISSKVPLLWQHVEHLVIRDAQRDRNSQKNIVMVHLTGFYNLMTCFY